MEEVTNKEKEKGYGPAASLGIVVAFFAAIIILCVILKAILL